MGCCFKLNTLALCTALLLIINSPVSARNLTVVNFGGANGNAQSMAFIRPYEKAYNENISPITYNGNQARIREMVAAGNVLWDLVEVETADLINGCNNGLYEKIDWHAHLKASDLIDGAIQSCGVGTFVWSTVLAYNTANFDQAPASWADFWDTTKYPGKRGLRYGARYNLEFALMADGVTPDDAYNVLATPAGVDRAFAKLDEINPSIFWWHSGTEPVRRLMAGDITMSSAYNGRIDVAQRQGMSLGIVWPQSIYDMDYWVVIAGSPNIDRAINFIKLASSEPAQSAYSSMIAYGPINKESIKNLAAKDLKNIPNSPENSKNALRNNLKFWSKHGPELESRFNAWYRAKIKQ